MIQKLVSEMEMIDLSDSTEEKVGDLDGVSYVSTPGHGYLAFTGEAANLLLSPAAQKEGQISGRALYYEHDSAISVPMIDSPEVLKALHSDKSDSELESVRREILDIAARFHGDYVEAMGFRASHAALSKAEEAKLADKMREEKSPDLIKAAWGSWRSFSDDEVMVCTADESLHYVNKKAYQGLRGRSVLLLSECGDVTAYADAKPAKERFKEFLPEKVISNIKNAENAGKSVTDESLKDMMHSHADDIRAAMIHEAEYFEKPALPVREAIHRTQVVLNEALKSDAWDVPEAGAMRSPAFRQEMAKGGMQLLRRQLSNALSREEFVAPSQNSIH